MRYRLYENAPTAASGLRANAEATLLRPPSSARVPSDSNATTVRASPHSVMIGLHSAHDPTMHAPKPTHPTIQSHVPRRVGLRPYQAPTMPRKNSARNHG